MLQLATMRKIIPFLIILVFTSRAQPVLAAFEKIDYVNNKFGIHLAVASEEDIVSAANLVNSAQGDWGYVTLVIQENDRDLNKWQNVFDCLRERHLIPLIRIATQPVGESWRKPELADIPAWVEFLNSLNWVIKNRYLILFNEPNHANEWGGKTDPQDYGEISFSLSKALKETNPDFFIMLAGFDAAAPSQPPLHEDEEKFLRLIIKAYPDLFSFIDGWASHAYPNHGFVGSPLATGRHSVKGYLWELSLLKRLGINKELPVFITETGWPHHEGIEIQRGFYFAENVANNFKVYFENLIKDPRVIAVTPFILNYQGEPFDHFSWQKPNSKEFYPQYQTVQQIPKVKGKPKQVHKLEVLSKLPEKLIEKSTYQIPLRISNLGQSIWNQEDGYRFNLSGDLADFEYFFSDFNEIAPFREKGLWLYFKTKEKLGNSKLLLSLQKDNQTIVDPLNWNLEIIPKIDIKINTELLFKNNVQADDFKFLIYGPKEEVVFEVLGLKVNNNQALIENVNNLAIGEKYRAVLLKPYCLPRQTIFTAQQEKNEISFKKMLPLDFNLDGKFSFKDFFALMKKPNLIKIWWTK